VELFSVNIAGEVTSLRIELYMMALPKEEGIASYFMRLSQIRDQLQELGEIMPDTEMTPVVLNALPYEWGNFVSSIYGKKEATPFNELWSLCKIEEIWLKARSDVEPSEKVQAFAAVDKRKGKFGKFGPQKNKKIDMSKIQCYECREYGHFKRDCPKLKKENKKRKERIEADIIEEVEDLDEKKHKKEGIYLHY